MPSPTATTRAATSPRRAEPKPGSTLADIVTSAIFPVGCSNPVTRNKPLSTTDALGHVTDYVHDETHGGVTRIRLPAPAAGMARPWRRFDYVEVDGVTLPLGVAACSGGGGDCDGEADEIETRFGYGANLNLTQATTGSGAAATMTVPDDNVLL